MASGKANIETSRRALEEAFGEGKPEILDEICSADFIGHDPLAGDQDVAGVKQSITGYRNAFPDLTFTIDDIFAAGDLVAMRWRGVGTFENAFMGQPPTGEKGKPTEGISIDRYDNDGKLVESWNQWDTVGFLQEIGMIPTGAEAAAS